MKKGVKKKKVGQHSSFIPKGDLLGEPVEPEQLISFHFSINSILIHVIF